MGWVPLLIMPASWLYPDPPPSPSLLPAERVVPVTLAAPPSPEKFTARIKAVYSVPPSRPVMVYDDVS